MYTLLDLEKTKMSKASLMPSESSQSSGGGRQVKYIISVAGNKEESGMWAYGAVEAGRRTRGPAWPGRGKRGQCNKDAWRS